MRTILKRYKDLSIPVKAALWFTVCSIVQKGISFITVPIFTRLLSVDEYGIYSVYNSWLSLFTILATLKMYSGCYFNGLYKYSEKNSFTSSIQSLETFITIAVFGIVVLFSDQIMPLVGLSNIFIVLMMAKILVTPPIEFWLTEQRVTYKYRNLVFLTICIALFNPLLGIIGILSTQTHHAEMRVLGGLIVYLVFGIVFYVRNIWKGRTIYCSKYWIFALRFDVPLLPHNLALSVLGQSDRIMINNMVGAEQAAIYSLAYSVSMTLQIVKDAIRDALLPWIYKKIKEGSHKEIRDVVNIILIFISLISFLFIAFAPEVVMIMGSDKYYEAIWIMPPVATSLYFMFLYNVFSSIEFYYEKTKYAMAASVVSALLNIILNLIFINIFGYMAAGYTTLFCYVALAVSHYFMAKSVLKARKETFEMLDSRFVLIYSLFVLGFSFAFALVYEIAAIRYMMILLLTGILLAMRKRISALFVQLKQAKKNRKNGCK